jgi:hypothetical protein
LAATATLIAALVVTPQFAAPDHKPSDIHVAALRATDASRAAAVAELRQLVGASESLSVMYQGIADHKRMESRLATALPLFDVHIARLRRYGSDVDPVTLLMLPTAVFYPVIVDRQAIGILEVARRSDGDSWKIASRGRRTLATAIMRARAGAQLQANASAVLVSIPSLNQLFLAVLEGDRLWLMPLVNQREYGFWQGQMLDAAVVFSRLRSTAQRWSAVGPG